MVNGSAIAIGVGVGAALGTALGNIAMGLVLGLVIGIMLPQLGGGVRRTASKVRQRDRE